MKATSIEESRELIRFGLDPKTADCWWSHSALVDNGTPLWVHTVDPSLHIYKLSEDDIPAWSVDKMLELLPMKITCGDKTVTDLPVVYDLCSDGYGFAGLDKPIELYYQTRHELYILPTSVPKRLIDVAADNWKDAVYSVLLNLLTGGLFNNDNEKIKPYYMCG